MVFKAMDEATEKKETDDLDERCFRGAMEAGARLEGTEELIR